MRRQLITRRTFFAGAGATVGAVALPACRGGGQSTGGAPGKTTLRLLGGDFGFPSPFTYVRGPGYVQMSYIYDTLLWRDSTGKQLPWLASRYERSEDGTRYTFELRKGLRWQDDRPVTPEDVVFSYEYYAENTLSPEIIVQPVPDITDVRVTGERTVEFRLKNPVVTFADFGGAGAVPIVPKRVWQSVKDPAKASDPELLVGCGPYRLKSYEPGQGAYSYTAYNGYHLGKPVIKRIENVPTEDPLGALRAGELDQASTSEVRPKVLEPFRDDPAYRVLKAPPGSTTLSLHWNLAKGGALADPRFRHACARAIDRGDLVQRLFGGNGEPGNPGWIPPRNPWHVDVEQYAFDRAAAERLLDEAGYEKDSASGVRTTPEGRPLRFSLLTQNQPVPPALDLVVRSLKAIGVELTPKPVDTPTFNSRVIKGDTEMSLIVSGGMNSDLAPDYLRLVYPSYTKLTQHAQGYKNPEVDKLCREQLATLDQSRRRQIVAEIQRLVAHDLPLLPLFYPDSFTIYNVAAFERWYYTPGGVAGNIPTVNNKQVFVTGKKTVD